MNEAQLDSIYQAFSVLADRKREILDEDLLALVHESFEDAPEEYQLTQLRVTCGNGQADGRGAADRPLDRRAERRRAGATAPSPPPSTPSARPPAAPSTWPTCRSAR